MAKSASPLEQTPEETYWIAQNAEGEREREGERGGRKGLNVGEKEMVMEGEREKTDLRERERDEEMETWRERKRECWISQN